jgi:hypothetical protein
LREPTLLVEPVGQPAGTVQPALLVIAPQLGRVGVGVAGPLDRLQDRLPERCYWL